MPKPIRKARQVRRSHGGPKGSQPGPRHPPGIQQGPRVRPQGGLQRKAMHTRQKVSKTKFQTLTNQPNTNVSQYTTPAAHDIRVTNVGAATSGMRLPDGAPYVPGATYQFHGDGTYTRIPGPGDVVEEEG